MFSISKTFHFSAAHHLERVGPDHPCHRVHGHNYEVTVLIRTHTLDDQGMVLDYRQLDWFKTYLDDTLDHRDLNEVLAAHASYLIDPTAEILAQFLWERVHGRLSWMPNAAWEVTVCETPSTAATYSGPILTERNL